MKKFRRNLRFVAIFAITLFTILKTNQSIFQLWKVFSSTIAWKAVLEDKVYRQVHFTSRLHVLDKSILEAAWENNERCKTSRIGCASKLAIDSLTSQPEFRFDNLSLRDCTKLCSNKGFLNMFHSGEMRCLCMKLIPFECVQDENVLTFEGNTCADLSQYKVYSVVKCTEIKEESDFMESLIGCFPTSVYASETLYAAPSRMPPNKCLLVCESEGFLLAISIRMEECYCFDPTVRSGFPKSDDAMNNSLCKSSSTDHMFVMRTYVEDTRCPPKKFMTSSRDLISLKSFPGSGNTWTRHLLESASGYYTGSVYTDELLYGQGFLGEFDGRTSTRTLVIKEHCEQRSDAFAPCMDTDKFRLTIFIIRNPFDAIVSEYNRLLGGGHTSVLDEAKFKTKDWFHKVIRYSQRWSNTIINAFTSNKTIHIVFYEDLVVDPIAKVRKMLEFTGVNIEDLEQRILCTQGDLKGNFKRSKPKVKQNRYPPELVKTIKKAIIDTINALPSNPQIQKGLSRYL